jgi:hypothetical protein
MGKCQKLEGKGKDEWRYYKKERGLSTKSQNRIKTDTWLPIESQNINKD